MEKIDFKKITPLLKHFLDKGLNFIKLAFSAPGSKRYVIYSVIALIFFCIILFPYDLILLKQMKFKSIKGIQTNDAKISLIGGISASFAEITSSSGTVYTLTNPDIDLSFISLLWNKISTDIEIEKLTYTSGGMNANSYLKGEISAKLNDKTNLPEDGSLEFELKKLVVTGLTIKGFNIPPVKADSLKIKIEFTPKTYKVLKIEFSGKEISGKVTGNIAVNNMSFGSSTVDLKAEIDSKSTMLDNYRMLLNFISDPNSPKINFIINGTIDNMQVQPEKSAGGTTPPTPGNQPPPPTPPNQPPADGTPMRR